MAIKQNNKTQSTIRFNLSNILGLSEEQVKMVAQNQYRLLGGLGFVYFNGLTTGSESGETTPTCTPCGGNDDSGGGSGGGGGGLLTPCTECVSIAKAAEMTASGETPCCIDSKNCETGENMPICLTDNCGGGYGQDCTPPPYGECTTVVIYFSWTGGADYKLTTLKKVASDINSGIEENFGKAVQNLGGGEIQNETTTATTRILNCGSDTYEINYNNAKRGFVVNKGWANSTASFNINPTQTDYNRGLENWEKPSGKYLKNGKFYDACDIDGDDCITVCDENGNQYKICANNGNPKVTPITE